MRAQKNRKKVKNVRWLKIIKNKKELNIKYIKIKKEKRKIIKKRKYKKENIKKENKKWLKLDEWGREKKRKKYSLRKKRI